MGMTTMVIALIRMLILIRRVRTIMKMILMLMVILLKISIILMILVIYNTGSNIVDNFIKFILIYTLRTPGLFIVI